MNFTASSVLIRKGIRGFSRIILIGDLTNTSQIFFQSQNIGARFDVIPKNTTTMK